MAILQSWYPALAIASYRRLWSGIVPYHFAFQFGLVTTGVAALSLTDSAVAVGLLVGAWGFPIMVAPPLGGLLADRRSRRQIMLASQVVLGLAAFTVGIAALAGVLTAWQVFLFGLVQGTTFAFFAPARTAYTAKVVGRDLIPNAIAAYSLSDYGSGIVGPAVAGVALSVLSLGIGGAYLLMAALYAFVFVLFLPLPDDVPAPTPGVTAWSQLGDAVGHIRATRPLRTVVALGAAATLLGMPFLLLMPVFAERVYDIGPGGLGALLAAAGVGSVGGVLLASRLRSESAVRLSQPLFGIALGLAIVGFAVAPTVAVALVAAAAAGLASSAFAVVNYSRLLMHADPELYGRVASIFQLTFALGPVGSVPIGALADAVGPRTAVGVGGILLAIIVAFLVGGQATAPGLRARAEP